MKISIFCLFLLFLACNGLQSETENGIQWSNSISKKCYSKDQLLLLNISWTQFNHGWQSQVARPWIDGRRRRRRPYSWGHTLRKAHRDASWTEKSTQSAYWTSIATSPQSCSTRLIASGHKTPSLSGARLLTNFAKYLMVFQHGSQKMSSSMLLLVKFLYYQRRNTD